MTDISKLVETVGADNIQAQLVDEATIKLARKKDHNEITLLTDQPWEVGEEGPSSARMEKFGIILWMPRDEVQAAVDAWDDSEEEA